MGVRVPVPRPFEQHVDVDRADVVVCHDQLELTGDGDAEVQRRLGVDQGVEAQMPLGADRPERGLHVDPGTELQRTGGDRQVRVGPDAQQRAWRQRHAQPAQAGQAGWRRELRVETACGEHEALGAATQREVACDVERPDPRSGEHRIERDVAGCQIDRAGEVGLEMDDGRGRIGNRDLDFADDHDCDRAGERVEDAGGHSDD